MWPKDLDPLTGLFTGAPDGFTTMQDWAMVSTDGVGDLLGEIVKLFDPKPPTPKVINPLRLCPDATAKLLHAALDADPSDQGVRALLADHLEDLGEPWAAGLRWLVANGKWPKKPPYAELWDWWISNVDAPHATIPKAAYWWIDAAEWGNSIESRPRCRWYGPDGRRTAEAWLCAYFEAAEVPERFLGEG